MKTKFEVILLKSHDADYVRIVESDDIVWELENGYVKVSKPITIEFLPLPEDKILQDSIAAFDTEIDKVEKEFTVRLAKLHQKKQELLALPISLGEVL